MTCRLEVILTFKDWRAPLTKEFFYTGDTLDDCLDQIDTQDHHRHNLRLHKRTAFRSTDGVKHTWKLTTIRLLE